MDIFGFKLTQVHGCFKLKYMTLFMMLISCAWTQDIPSFNVTCDSSGLYVKIAFSKPFNGIVYAKGYRFDPLCTMTKSSVLDGSLALPLAACGTFVHGTNHLCITNTVAIQQHPLISTVNDFEKSIICSLSIPSKNFWDSALLDQIYESHSLPMINSSYLKFGADVFLENSAAIFDYRPDCLSIFQLPNETIYNDFGIRSCIAHNSEILSGNASALQINHPEGCFTTDSENSVLKFIRIDKGLMAYVEMENLEIESSDSFFLICEIILCKTKCICSEIDQQKEDSTAVISHKLTKRSIETSSEIFSLKQYEARTRYLKSTVKALMDRITEQRNQKDKSKIRKRLMRLEDSSSLSDTNSIPSHAIVAGTEIFSPEPVSSEIYNVEPHLADIYQDYDNKESSLDYDHDESHQDDDHNESHQDYDRNEPSTELSTDDSDTTVKLPKQFNNDSEISEEFQVKVLNESGVWCVKETMESIKTVNTTGLVFPPIVEIASDHHGSCIPRLRFVVIIVAMGFLVGCLLLVSCGMALYIRKEKKRNRMNDFLLYSISF